MSLMDEMKNVVTIGRELFTTVSGKMKEIDDSVQEVRNSVAKTINDKAYAEIFIDPQNGNDSNSGTTTSAPVKTLDEVESRIVAGSTLRLLLLGDLVIDKAHDFTYGCTVWIEGHGAKRQLIFKTVRDAQGRDTLGMLHQWKNVTFYFKDIVFDLDISTASTALNFASSRNCAIGTNATTSPAPTMYVRATSCDFKPFIDKAASAQSANEWQVSFMEIVYKFTVFYAGSCTFSSDQAANKKVMFRDINTASATDKILVTLNNDLVRSQA